MLGLKKFLPYVTFNFENFCPSFTRGHGWKYQELTKLVSTEKNAPILFSSLVFPFKVCTIRSLKNDALC